MKEIHSIKHITKYNNVNGKLIEDANIIELNNNGLINIRKLSKPKCAPFRRNHLLFTNKRRGKSVSRFNEKGGRKKTQKRRQK